ncbi:MAG: NUDIX hydrolase [Chloroflexota bacterium]
MRHLPQWKTLSRRLLLKVNNFLTVESHEVELPDGRVIPDWAWVITPDAAIVVAETVNGRFLCFHQTKYAVEGTTLAPVGGHIEADETPLAAAKRELLEETGYEAAEWIELGSYVVGPNRGFAKRHLFFARQAAQVAEPTSDDLEEQDLLILSLEELEKAVQNGEFKVAVWTAAVALALQHLYRENNIL